MIIRLKLKKRSGILVLGLMFLTISSCKDIKKTEKAVEEISEEVVEEVSEIVVPDWAYPGSETHEQVPPPLGFHRITRTDNTPIGIFDGQSDVGGALIEGSSSYDEETKQYTISSAGYNIWYSRDEFRFLWKKMSGDLSLATDIDFPIEEGYLDRKAVLIVRQNLDDDSKEVMVALHGGGLMHLAYRTEKEKNLEQIQVPETGALRLGFEKKGDAFAIYASMNGEPMKKLTDETVDLHFEEPFYVGIGFTSHEPIISDTTILSNVVLENEAGKVQ